ncbi:MAG: 3-phosphoserine/phosphohydroxythreonine transaminase [Acidobacteria bacterium]|nr:3-phosphoserine/phosphohydroxythreonine transaminase [Acidobacteriota bacterium]
MSGPAERVYNFGAGPAVLPEPVLREVQEHLLALPGAGMSVLEISHRSAAFEEILTSAESGIRALAGVPDGYHVLFLQGGATQQFAMVPMNLLAAGATADYVVTGSWARKAAAEARRFGTVRVAATTEPDGFTRVPAPTELALTRGAAYVHLTSNNTIAGTQWAETPDTGDSPLVVDASSDILSRPIDVARHGLIYAGAQKNLGPAGVTVVIVRDELVRRAPQGLPTLMRYETFAESRSLHNTPPVFAIYVVALVTAWIRDAGGLDEMSRRNERKAQALYDVIDASSFYRGTAEPASRSRMNVTFRLPTPELDAQFVREAGDAGLAGLKGHRSVGGQRASIYNAFPEAGVAALVDFMREFERTRS